MIEGEKRYPTIETVASIYDAFHRLTKGEIENLYTKQIFLMTERERAQVYLEDFLQNEEITPSESNKYLRVAEQYELWDIKNKIEMELGFYYQSQLNDALSTDYFLKALKNNNNSNYNINQILTILMIR